MQSAQLISAFVTMFVVVDPIGLGPIFLAVTEGMSPSERRRTAIEAALISFALLAGAALAGEWLLHNLGIGIAAFRIAGGLLLFVIGFEMLFDRRQRRKAGDASSDEGLAGVSVFPLAIPLMSGPGAITAAVLLSGRTNTEGLSLVALILIFAVVIGIALLLLLAASWLARVVPPKGQMVFVRLLGILLAALAIQFVIDGIAEAVSGFAVT